MTGLSLSTTVGPGLTEPLELIARMRGGDEAAFASLVSAYQPRVFRWAIGLSGDQDEAEDITQEVFVRAYRKLGSFRGEGSFDGWLYRITRRVAGRTRRAAVPRAEARAQDVYVTDPGARVDRQRAVALIRTVAETLPMRQREVFVLCDLEGRTPAEAAALLKMKDVSVRASLFKARASIRRRILATHPSYREQSP
jgi:RNA polymerase sigma-70 factor (ECF subfamily)